MPARTTAPPTTAMRLRDAIGVRRAAGAAVAVKSNSSAGASSALRRPDRVPEPFGDAAAEEAAADRFSARMTWPHCLQRMDLLTHSGGIRKTVRHPGHFA